MLSSVTLFKCFVDGYKTLSPFSTDADQGEDAGKPVARKDLLNICVYPRAKTNRLYLSQSNIPSTERNKDKKDMAWHVASAMPGSPILSYIQTEKILSSENKIESAALSAESKHILDIYTQDCDSMIHPLS